MAMAAIASVVGPHIRMDMAKELMQDVPYLMGPLDNVLAAVCDAAGFSPDHAAFVISMVACIPLAFIHSILPNIPLLKHVYTAVTGWVISWFCFREQSFHIILALVVSYVLVLLGRSNSKMPLLVTALNCLYLLHIHLYQQYSDWLGGKLDFTTLQMITTIKLSQFAWNVYDGSRGEAASKTQQKWGLKQVPSPLVVFAYVFYFPSLCTGPSFEITDYIRFTNLEMYKSRPGGKMPFGSRMLAVLKYLVMCGVWYGLMEVCKQFSITKALCIPADDVGGAPDSPCTELTVSETFAAYSLPVKIGYVWLAGSVERFKFYFAWTLSDVSSTMIGLNWKQDKDGKETFDRIKNCNERKIELAESVRDSVNNWNYGVANWLRYYVYERAIEAGTAKGVASNYAFGLSALWHGCYPGYYTTFFLGNIGILTSRNLRRWLRPKFVGEDKQTPFWYNMAGMVMASFCLNMAVLGFLVLDFWRFWVIAKSIYFVPHIIIMATYFISMQGAAGAKKKDKKDKSK